MKKILAIMLALSSLLLLAGCQKKEKPVDGGDHKEKPDLSATFPVRWFDGYHTGDMLFGDEVKGYSLDEFPDVSFRCSSDKLEALVDGKSTVLYGGMSILSVYFCDLTGDGKHELCSTVSIGSGIMDDRVVVYDYAVGKKYELQSRGEFDYVLNLKDGEMVVEKRAFKSAEILETGKLVIADDELRMETERE